MRILILSDSHRDTSFLNYVKDFDYVLHLGDYCCEPELLKENSIIFVNGNCDRGYEAKEKELTIAGIKYLMVHGHNQHVKLGTFFLENFASRYQPNVCLYGHTHYPNLFIKNGTVFINPGCYLAGSYVIIEDKSIIFMNSKGIVRKEDNIL